MVACVVEINVDFFSEKKKKKENDNTAEAQEKDIKTNLVRK